LPDERRVEALLRQVILDGEGHTTLEAGGCQDVTGVPRVPEPRHDRAQALGDASGGIADAVIVDEENAHDNSVRTSEW
jgi:hypothetical protein